MRSMVAAFLLVAAVSFSYGQQDSTWGRWSWIMGTWEGEGAGQPGRGSGYFSFQPILDGKVLQRTNHSDYPGSADQPPINHDDLMFIYLDESGHPGRAIFFDNEGHTINYAIDYTDSSIVLTSGKTEKSPAFRLTYTRLDGGLVGVKFEMSSSGTTFRTYVDGKCRRKM